MYFYYYVYFFSVVLLLYFVKIMKLSIITINYNDKIGLSKTINSVLDQTWSDYEFIIIDGGSSDGSFELICEYKDYFTYWVSEPDNGVFHAMNKGIKKARGNYLLMLNSGDFLFGSNVLSQVFEVNDFNQDILYGDVFRESNGVIIDESIFPDLLDLNFFHDGAISHQAAFVKRELHNRVGLYDEKLIFSSDWKFFVLSICKFNLSYKHLDFKVSVCNCDGLTCSSSNFYKISLERDVFLKNYFPIYYNNKLLEINQRDGLFVNRVLLYYESFFRFIKSCVKNALP